MGFHIGPDCHVSLDQQIRGFRVALRAAEVFYMLSSEGFVNFEAH